MSCVRFYLHDQKGAQPVLDMACRLLHKLWRERKQVYVWVPDQQMAETLDEALWIYEPATFIPHARYAPDQAAAGSAQAAAIQIGDDTPPTTMTDTLLNLSNKVLPTYTQFDRILELVSAETEMKEAARKRYQSYQAAGCEMLELHQESRIRSLYFRQLSSPAS